MFTPITQARGTSSDKLKPYVYNSDIIPLVWDEMEAVLLPCIEESNGILCSKDLYKWLVEGHAVAFATTRREKIVAVLIVMKVNYASFSVARIVACAGKDLRGAAEFVDALEAWAFTQGCVELEAWCRESVVRLLRPLGWRKRLTIVHRDLRRKLQ